MKITLSILAGGKSRRFGVSKCTYKVNEKSMVEMIVESISHLFDEVIIVGSDLKENGIRSFDDIHKDKGPVAGLESSLIYARNEYVFLTACDMPLISEKVVSRMIERINDQNVLCPFINEKYQTTHAIYSKNILPLIEKELERTKSTLTHVVLTASKVEILKEDFFHDLKGYEESFMNFNSLQELKSLKERFFHF